MPKRITKSSATAEKSTRGLNQDRNLVAGNQPYEVAYEAKKTGAPKAAVKDAIKEVGNSRKAVEKKLSGK